MFSYSLTTSCSNTRARLGSLQTPHGMVETPAFMPVGTRGAIKGLLPEQVRQAGSQIILANTYHLLLRPGPDVVEAFGGLHGFMSWDGPILTDSGGFQVFSLSSLHSLKKMGPTDDEIIFNSHIDGARCILSPGISMQVQNQLGADIIMVFDECVELPCTRERMELAVERTLRWAAMSQEAHRRDDQWLFGIVQGGTDQELRHYCSEKLIAMDFPGYAIGGLSVGESHDEMIETVDFTTQLLPIEKPRYLMGVGTPRDLIAAIAAGIDMFDCVMPTRNARHATAFTREGPIKLKNEQYKLDKGPLDENCDCYACRHFSRGYIRHLFMVERKNPELLGPILVSLHNITFYQWLMKQTRQAIRENNFLEWSRQWAEYGLSNQSETENERTYA